MDKHFYTVSEVAQALQKTTSWVYRHAHALGRARAQQQIATKMPIPQKINAAADREQVAF